MPVSTSTQLKCISVGSFARTTGTPNRTITTVIAAGDAAGLFPVITPAAEATPTLNSTASTRTGAGSIADLPPGVSPTAIPSPAPETGPRAAERSVGPAADASATSPGLQVLAVGLIAVALAIMLAMTRLSARRRTGARGRQA